MELRMLRYRVDRIIVKLFPSTIRTSSWLHWKERTQISLRSIFIRRRRSCWVRLAAVSGRSSCWWNTSETAREVPSLISGHTSSRWKKKICAILLILCSDFCYEQSPSWRKSWLLEQQKSCKMFCWRNHKSSNRASEGNNPWFIFSWSKLGNINSKSCLTFFRSTIFWTGWSRKFCPNVVNGWQDWSRSTMQKEICPSFSQKCKIDILYFSISHFNGFCSGKSYPSLCPWRGLILFRLMNAWFVTKYSVVQRAKSSMIRVRSIWRRSPTLFKLYQHC